MPGLGRFPCWRHGNPLQYSCLENPEDRGAWWATVHGVAKSWTWFSDSTTIFTFKEYGSESNVCKRFHVVSYIFHWSCSKARLRDQFLSVGSVFSSSGLRHRLLVLWWTGTWWSGVDDGKVKEGKRLIFPGLCSQLSYSRESARNRDKEKERKKERTIVECCNEHWGACILSDHAFLQMCVCAKWLQSCLTLSDPMNCSLPGSSVRGILQARILEW